MSDEFGLPLYYADENLEKMQDRLKQEYLASSGWNESAAAKLALRNGRPVPWFTYSAMAFLEKEITPDLSLFEYGGGQSTLYWAERMRRVVSVDHDQSFVDFIRPKLPAHAEFKMIGEHELLSEALSNASRDRPRFVDPPRDVRTYRGGQLNESFAGYALEVMNWPKDTFDVVVVDGMARVLSTWAAIQHFDKGGFIVFDNAERSEYQAGYDMLADADYRRIDFSGLGPINPYGWTTSVFYRPAAFAGTSWFRGATRAAPAPVPESAPNDRLGIVVLGFNRPLHLQSVLESLRLQDRISHVHVWIDGTQQRGEFRDANLRAIEIARRYKVKDVCVQNGHLGIEKLMINALDSISQDYSRVLVLEDDCFPTQVAVDTFEHNLASVVEDPNVFSVYGHHFGVEDPKDRNFTRFQGWGWAAHSKQIRVLLPELKHLFMMNEQEYAGWVKANLTEEVMRRLDTTPGRNVLHTLAKAFSWDSALSLLTASRRMAHRRTFEPVVINTGITPGIGHFESDTATFRNPPFNMVTLGEAWAKYDKKTEPLPLDGQSRGLDQLDKLIEKHVTQTSGFLIEIGAYDGIDQTNSALFEAKGWKGMLIEANPGSYARCVQARPGMIVENFACVSEDFSDDVVTITDVGLMSMTGTSNFDDETRSDWTTRGEGFLKRRAQNVDVPVTTMSKLLDKHQVTAVDMLLLDVEGAEIDVLEGLDFARHAPRVIVAEDAYTDDVERYLRGKGYHAGVVLLERKYTRDQLYIRTTP